MNKQQDILSEENRETLQKIIDRINETSVHSYLIKTNYASFYKSTLTLQEQLRFEQSLQGHIHDYWKEHSKILFARGSERLFSNWMSYTMMIRMIDKRKTSFIAKADEKIKQTLSQIDQFTLNRMHKNRNIDQHNISIGYITTDKQKHIKGLKDIK